MIVQVQLAQEVSKTFIFAEKFREKTKKFQFKISWKHNLYFLLLNYKKKKILFSGHCATTTISRINDDSVADVVSQAPSLNTSERSTTYLQMPSMQNISNNHASSQNGGIQNNHVTSSKMTLINKSLSYMQNFRTLLSRQDWIFFINYIQYIHSNLDITNFDKVNFTI